MNSADWGILIPVIVTFLTAASAWLKGHTAQKVAVRAERKADANTVKLNGMGNGSSHQPGGPPAP